MSRGFPWCALGVSVSVVVVSLVSPARAGNAAPSPVAGAWRLDPSHSDDAQEKLREQRKQHARRGPNGLGGPGLAPGGGGGVGGGVPGSPGGFGSFTGSVGVAPNPAGLRLDPQAILDAWNEVLVAPEVLTIGVGSDEVTITGFDGGLRRLRPNGKKTKRNQGAADSRTRWDGDVLVNETWIAGSALHVTERYARDRATGELHCTLALENSLYPDETVTVRRVYVPESDAPQSGGDTPAAP
jgi:hypothetical protein